MVSHTHGVQRGVELANYVGAASPVTIDVNESGRRKRQVEAAAVAGGGKFYRSVFYHGRWQQQITDFAVLSTPGHQVNRPHSGRGLPGIVPALVLETNLKEKYF